MADRLELEARFKDSASAGVKKLGKTLADVKPSRGMEAANAWMKGFRKEADEALRAARPVSSVLGGIGVSGLAAGFSLREVVKQARELADSTLQMKELGRQASMSADQIRQLQYAAGKLHVDPSAMSNAISSWSSKMVEFKRHLPGIYTDLMRQNAAVARKIEADSPAEALKESLRFLSQIKDPQIQKRWAEEWGLGDLAPMLGKGLAGLNDAFAEAGREVKPLTKDMVDAAERLNDATNKLDTTWSNFKNEFGPIVLTGVSGAVDQFRSVLKDIEAAHDRYSGHPENVTKDATANENAIGSNFVRHWSEVLKGERPILPNPFDSRSWHFPNVRDGLFDYTKGGDGEAPSGVGFSKTSTTRRGEDGNALHRWDEMPTARPSASDKWKTPARYEAEARARALGLPAGHDLKEEVREGSKQGIIQGLRELAQQQELNGGMGGDGGPGGTLGAAHRLLGKAGIAAGARPRASGGFTAASGGGTTKAGGSLASNQRIAYDQFLKDGWSPAAARAMTANDSGEGLAHDANRVHWDRTHNSGGIVQWDPQRAEAIKRQFGVYPWQMSVADQARAQSWEIRNNPRFAPTLRALQKDNAADMIGALVDNYESPLARAKAKAERMGYWRGFNPDAQPTPGAGTPTPSSAAISDAERFKAQQRLINGGRDPADRALIERYKAQQAKPEKHRAGGWIRGRGTSTSDSIPAMLSNGEYVVRAKAAGRWLPLLHAINSGDLARFAGGGPVGFGVAKRFYPTSSPGISDAEGAGNRRFWRDFMRKPQKDGGMGAPWRTTLAALAMMQGESGRGLNSKLYNWDVNGPSGGVDQLHDVTTGRGAGRLHRLSDLMRLATLQHADWRDPWVQAANFKREALGDMNFAWSKMLAAKTARGALKAGIDKFENPANHGLELLRRAPNIVKLAREMVGDRAATPQELGPLDVTIRHHPHTGHPIVTARAGKGMRLNLRSGPTMRPT